MKKTLILTPNKIEMCGMYQLAKDLAKEFDGEIITKQKIYFIDEKDYKQVITLMYPMHILGKKLKEKGVKWICYNQGIPPVNKTYFPDFKRRQAMRYINWQNNLTMQHADEYWDVTEREQKPRWTKKSGKCIKGDYAIYLGRTTDYKNFDWLKKTMEELNISLEHPQNLSYSAIWVWLSNARMLVTASLWEGFGRTPMESEAMGVPAVAYDVGAHKRHIKKGICVHLDIDEMEKSQENFKKAVLEVWNRK